MKAIAKDTMNSLLRDMIDREFDINEVRECAEAICAYRKAWDDFQESTTPESEALARWRMGDSEDDLKKVLSDFSLDYSVSQFVN